MQTDNPFLDSMAKFFTNAAGAAQAAGAELESMVKARFERFIADMDFVPRDEFDAVKAMAAKARSENDALTKRVAALEDELRTKESQTREKTPETRSVDSGIPKL